MSKHTPGPWKVTLCEAYDDGSRMQCEIVGPRGIVCNTDESDHEESKANARLIACAPEMLEFIKQVYKEHSESEGGYGDAEYISMCEKIIAKAEGKENEN